MKRYLRFIFLTLFIATLAFPQAVKVQRLAKSAFQLGLSSSTATTWPVSSGLRVVAKGQTVYFKADTTGSGATTVTSFAWTLTSKPGGSAAALDTVDKQTTKLVVDLIGQYIVTVSVNGGAKTSADTIFVSTYLGDMTSNFPGCLSACHTDKATYLQTNHASIYQKGISGTLSTASATGVTSYGTYCVKCHTTGWEKNVANGNFGNLAYTTGWDTAWYAIEVDSLNSTKTTAYFRPYNTSRWNTLNTDAKYSTVKKSAMITCESCHGAGKDHLGDKAKIGKSVDAGVCGQCHEKSTTKGPFATWAQSTHSNMLISKGASKTSTGCFPCHSGVAFVKFTNNKTTPNYALTDFFPSVSCATCHDPHESTTNADGTHSLKLRAQVLDSLTNGAKPPVGIGGKGLLCMNCHHSRYDNTAKLQLAKDILTKKIAGAFPSFSTHEGFQGDVYLGLNFNNLEGKIAFLAGTMTHDGVADACVTCHMAQPVGSTDATADHSMKMVDTNGNDKVTACRSCHGNINSFEDIKANSDYDGDGKVEASMTEFDGLMANLKSLLDTTYSATTGLYTVSNSKADSARIVANANFPRNLDGIYNYRWLENDLGHGVHNMRLAINLLTYTIQYIKFGDIPVELTSFAGSVNNGIVSLQWQTATEKNNKGFEVQRKVGTKWETIGFVNGKGTSTEVNRYSYSDNLSKLSVSGNISYRLRQVDFDGTAILTKEVNVSYTSAPKSFSLSQNYPNPFNPSTTIRYALPFDSNVKISIYKVTGELVKVLVSGTKTAGNYEITMNTAHENAEFSSGIYFYSIEANAVDGSNSFKQTKKMILLK
ncbi:MAG: T9SS type A sorting domain-containing protein [Ignavibacteriaceae bacterium]|nr:T9SS type A sorting domain-containing protein [Ignavibacteriaceae bacterium]